YEVGFMGENRKDNRQIKFRVSDHEYEELEQTANNFHMSVAAFAKKRAMGYRMKHLKVENSGAIEIAKQLRAIRNYVSSLKMRARNSKLSKRSCMRYGNNSIRYDWFCKSTMQLCGKKSSRKRWS